MLFRQNYLIIWVVLILAGCATHNAFEVAQDQVDGVGAIHQVSFMGRLVVADNDHSDSGSIEWRGDFVQQQVVLLSPLGTTVAELTHRPDQTQLSLSSDRVVSASNVEEVTNQMLGYPLPLDGMPWWILGLTWPDTAGEITHDKEGRVLTVKQDDWLISYGQWQNINGQWLPKRISLTQGGIKIRIIVDRWHIVRR
ncbi:lipoprotein insertase outer membrane protein LolB [Ferrovum sp. PN-J185]|uniref:lipoprotein insertase outer membrane protein LolB n=1 Tax=Ferrovum sp. PN-J185 TaxID=1356306 RepID=UPI001E602141|nr:lipoprotein insertase outer membrane protein LolB [Ferrovum sp. PN-J185]MCC6068865.1 lipoprotein insertase outer membrane protein LolB [Ferrovum sp. PN-J185]MDE2056197.1 outer membrane lipoprotein LolB [Betaproteobacteria bacterium]